jgi:hypothetical protein
MSANTVFEAGSMSRIFAELTLFISGNLSIWARRFCGVLYVLSFDLLVAVILDQMVDAVH